jgi:hypothetical protein
MSTRRRLKSQRQKLRLKRFVEILDRLIAEGKSPFVAWLGAEIQTKWELAKDHIELDDICRKVS